MISELLRQLKSAFLLLLINHHEKNNVSLLMTGLASYFLQANGSLIQQNNKQHVLF